MEPPVCTAAGEAEAAGAAAATYTKRASRLKPPTTLRGSDDAMTDAEAVGVDAPLSLAVAVPVAVPVAVWLAVAVPVAVDVREAVRVRLAVRVAD